MKIEIFDKAAQVSVEPVRLTLTSWGSGVMLCAVDKTGVGISTGHILLINEAGEVEIQGNMKVNGLKTRNSGRIVVRDHFLDGA